MRAKICDRCNGYYNPYKYTPRLKLTGISASASRYNKPLDLCKDCEQELVEWFKAKGNDPQDAKIYLDD